MYTPKLILERAKKEHWAVGHFNVSDASQMKYLVMSAQKLRAPMFIGTSEGERKFFGLEQAVALVRFYRETTGLPIFLNADHTKTLEGCKAAVDAGYDMIHFDGSALPFEENVAIAQEVVRYAHAKNSDISVEGELGYLRGASEVQERVEIKKEDYTQPEKAKEFLERTGVDRLAIVFGNFHGIATKQEEHLDLDHLSAVARVVPSVFLVLHGASGIADDEVRGAIDRGVQKVHFNTELRLAYVNGIRQTLTQKPQETTPYKVFAPGLEAMQKVVEHKIEIFGSKGKI